MKNILFIQTDQLVAFALGAYGNRYCQSPRLDALAKKGITFETAYCNFPLCAPSRYSMAAGQLASRVGAYDNAVEFPASIPTYAHYLRDLGYQTTLCGKMHFVGPDQLHGFEERLTADIYPADFSWAPYWENEGQRDTSDTTGVTVSGQCLDSVQLQYDNTVQAKALEKLQALAESDDKRPFFMQVSYTHPHDPYLCLDKHWALYEGKAVPEPAVPAMSANQHDNHSRRILAQHNMLDYAFDPKDTARARRAYFGSVSYLDDCVGELLDTLERLDLSKDTVVIFTSDHGEMLGERGMWFKKTFFEHSMRIPLLMYHPDWQGQQRVLTPVSLVDLLPTFMAIGIDGESSGFGDNIVNALDGSDITRFIERPGKTAVREPQRMVRAEYLAETTPAPIFMLRQGRFKFITSVADPDLLFDLESDPNELNNLATQADHSKTLHTMKAEVEKYWDNDTLTSDILLSQRRRKLVASALSKGAATSWDYDQPEEQPVPWYRGEGGYNQWAYAYTPVKNERKRMTVKND